LSAEPPPYLGSGHAELAQADIISDAERKRVLVEGFGISEQMADALPPDEPDGLALL
jgi:hypothetical protein